MLSIQQVRIFLLQNYFCDKPIYNMTFIVDLSGNINTKIFEKSVNYLSLIEPVLNTNITLVNEKPNVIINNKNKFKLKISEDDYQNIDNLLKNNIFNLEKDKLFQIVYCKNDNKLICLFHDLIIDGKTVLVFFDKLSNIYNCFINKKLPKINKNDYYKQNYNYNIDNLKNFISKDNFIEFPIEKLNNNFNFDEDRIYYSIDNKLYSKIKDFVKIKKITIFQLMQSVLLLIINKYTENKYICIDSIFDCSKNNSIGLYNNTVLIPFLFNDLNITIDKYLEKIKNNNKIIMDNKDIPLEYLINKLDLKSLPNIRIHFEYINKKTKFMFGDTSISSQFMENTSNVIRQLFWFNFGVHKSHIETYISFRKNLFNKESVIEMKNNILQVLNIIIDNKNIKLNEIISNIKIKTKFNYKAKNKIDYRFIAYKYAGNYPNIYFSEFKKLITI